MLLARSRHASVRFLERYARPSVGAVTRHVAERGGDLLERQQRLVRAGAGRGGGQTDACGTPIADLWEGVGVALGDLGEQLALVLVHHVSQCQRLYRCSAPVTLNTNTAATVCTTDTITEPTSHAYLG